MPRDRSRERSRERTDRRRERGSRQDRSRERSPARGRDRERGSERDSGRDRRDTDRGRDANRERERDRDRDRDRRDRDRHIRSRDHDRDRNAERRDQEDRQTKHGSDGRRHGKADASTDVKMSNADEDANGEGAAPLNLDADISPEEMQMMQAMGIPFGFDTTQGKHIEDGAVNTGAVKVKQKRRARQYMNRRGGFNRSLPPERTGQTALRD